jgi:hypothetical protein
MAKRPLKIAFDCFWVGSDFEEFKEICFFKAFRDAGIGFLELNPYIDECDIVFVFCFGHPDFQSYKGNPILISFRTEPMGWFSINEPYCKYHIGFKPDSDNDLYYPLWIPYLKDYYENRDKAINLTNKTDFCSFIVSNPICERRNNLFNFINSNYKHVDSLGKHLNNVGFILPKRDFDYPKKYKFNICFENTCSNEKYMYITEKIIWAYAYGCIPVYWGCSEIDKFFNPDSFINCNGLTDIEILERIKEIDSNDDLCLKMLNEPIFVDKEMNWKKWADERLVRFIDKALINEKNVSIYEVSV